MEHVNVITSECSYIWSLRFVSQDRMIMKIVYVPMAHGTCHVFVIENYIMTSYLVYRLVKCPLNILIYVHI